MASRCVVYRCDFIVSGKRWLSNTTYSVPYTTYHTTENYGLMWEKCYSEDLCIHWLNQALPLDETSVSLFLHVPRESTSSQNSVLLRVPCRRFFDSQMYCMDAN